MLGSLSQDVRLVNHDESSMALSGKSVVGACHAFFYHIESKKVKPKSIIFTDSSNEL